jgi:hypothetical protein
LPKASGTLANVSRVVTGHVVVVVMRSFTLAQ